MPASEYTTINRSWSMKMYVFLVVLLGFGSWGLVDAVKIYPERGIAYASLKQKTYLEVASGKGKLASASIEDPQARLAELMSKKDELVVGSLEGAAAEWLNALDLVGRLKPDYTRMSDPGKTYEELKEVWNSKDTPKPLSAFDLPLQWVFTAAGFGGSLWLIATILRVRKTRYGWHPQSQELTLPDGQSITPKDIRELDKRKWDKFYVTINTHAGQSITLDLLRFSPLEEWVLAMEKTAFPESEEPSAGPGEAAPANAG